MSSYTHIDGTCQNIEDIEICDIVASGGNVSRCILYFADDVHVNKMKQFQTCF